VRVSLKWLTEYVDLTLLPRELAHKLTMAGLEVEQVEHVGGDWDEELITVGEVLSVEPHPNADRLRLATVDYGAGEPLTVICGAPNVAAGQKIAFARAGASLIDGKTGEPSKLKAATIRGVESAGMVCSERELGLSEEHEGILVLPEDAPIGEPLARYLGDTILHIDLKPNRPDGLAMLGVAREVAALTDQTVREPEHTYREVDGLSSARAAVEIADPDLCSRYIGAVIEDVTIGESPRWMQERLIAAGMRPINNIVDVTNYVMLELGQPLHAFDLANIRGAKIIVRRARKDEKMTTLDGVEHELTPETLVIADAERAVAVAGVMGGLDSEVTDSTTTVLLESANFRATSIRRTATRMKTRTEASTRFEKGISAEMAGVAARRAVKLLVEITGGRALHGLIDVYPVKQQQVHVTLTRQRLSQVLGNDLPTSQVRHALAALGFGVHWQPPNTYDVRVPYWRTDVRIPDDVVEEVARIVGYESIPTKGLGGEIPPSEPQPRRDLRERLRDALAAAGMQEIVTYSLTTMEALRQVVPPEELATYPPLRVVSPASARHEYLRPVLRASLLETLAANARRTDGEIALFESARAILSQNAGEPDEQEHIAGVVSGRCEDRWGRPAKEAVDFFDAKGYVEAALRDAGLEGEFRQAALFGLVPGRSAEVLVDGAAVGMIGQVLPSVAGHFGIDQDVYIFELHVDALLPHAPLIRRVEAVSRYPPVEQDIAIVVEASVTARAAQSLIEAHSLVWRARLFDVYEGEPIGSGKKSLAFSVTYQSLDHTLTDDDVATAQDEIVQRLSRELNAELRS
jgi:phenylalanyl-tRNA synthetase beta chain